MISAELIANSRRNMLDTLADLSCVDRQRKYAEAVPYVHVPIELACQWDQHSSLMREQPWFRDSLSPAELGVCPLTAFVVSRFEMFQRGSFDESLTGC